MRSETAIPRALSIHQMYLPKSMPRRMSREAMESLRWCQPSAMSDWDSIFLPAQMENSASASLRTTETANTTIAGELKDAAA